MWEGGGGSTNLLFTHFVTDMHVRKRSSVVTKIQTHKRFKGTLFIRHSSGAV